MVKQLKIRKNDKIKYNFSNAYPFAAESQHVRTKPVGKMTTRSWQFSSNDNVKENEKKYKLNKNEKKKKHSQNLQ